MFKTMFKNLFPNQIVDNVNAIDLNNLKRNNIKGLIMDVDNTLVSNDEDELSEHVMNWLKEINDFGIKTCIVSNASKKRVDQINGSLKIPAIYRAWKPSRKPFTEAMKILDLKTNEIGVVGDQMFTDVRGGNRMGMYTILVVPICSKEFIGIKARRIIERIMLKYYYCKK